MLRLFVFHAYIKEIQGSRSKFPSKNIGSQRSEEGFNCGVRELETHYWLMQNSAMTSIYRYFPTEMVAILSTSLI
jgi:hypothetical protein